jgi:hypothetical protein
MRSTSWQEWNTTRAANLDDIEAAHRSIGGGARGRRHATEQINHAYAVLLASQFQGFCRDLHSECVDCIVRSIAPPVFQAVLRAEFLLNRSLDRGNANPGAIGADFNRLGVKFWRRVYDDHPQNELRKQRLEQLIQWRNAIAYQDFDPLVLGGHHRTAPRSSKKVAKDLQPTGAILRPRDAGIPDSTDISVPMVRRPNT